MDPAPSWPHPYVPILQAPLPGTGVASSSASGHLVQGLLLPSSASGRHDWVEYGDLLSQARMNFEFRQPRPDVFDPFPDQDPARSEPSPLQEVGGDDPCPPPYRRLARMGPPCADSNALLPVTMAMAMDQWTSAAAGNCPIATAVELPSTRQSSGNMLAFHNMSKLSMPDVQQNALSRSATQIHPPSGRKLAETRDESPPATLILKSPSDAPFESEEGGLNGVSKRSKVAAEPAAAPQQPKTQLMQSQPARSKEKVGERITALQQLVSPFGKTDTASVLSEAIGYIKFLQEQVQVLSSPYINPGIIRQDVGKISTTTKPDGETGSDLRSRGLCLVPVSCTLNVASSNGADYWASGISGGR